MFKPFPVFIGLRYTRAKKRNHFISFISLASMIGIALGVAVLITVLSVMNGFDYEIHNRIFGMAEQVTVNSVSGGIKNWENLDKQVSKQPDVLETAPFVLGQGMISNAGAVKGVMIKGILPEKESTISDISKMMVKGSMSNLKPGEFDALIGRDLAEQLGVGIGDKIVVITPEATMTPVGVVPRFKRFNITGIFHVEGAFGYDMNYIFIHINDAQKLMQMGSSVSGLRLKVKSLYDAPRVSDELSNLLSANYSVSNWTEEFGDYFKAIRMEKTTMFVVLLFIVAVAAFNLVSSLVMTVTDKQADIAILRTLGASPANIMSIFLVQGSVIGFIGTCLGVFSGILLAINAPAIVSGIEHFFHVQFISSSIYFINYLPSKLNLIDVMHVGLSSLIMSLLATIYPSWRASRIQPAEALRYE